MNDGTPLAPPGAGLPAMERWVARAGLGVARNVFSRRRIRDWLFVVAIVRLLQLT